MKFFGKRTKLGLSLGLSLLGVLVASISTAAWFQRTVVDTHQFSDDQAGTTGTSTVTQTEVNAYKYVYDNKSFGEVANTGTVVGSTGTENIDQDTTSQLNLFSQGAGFYIIGNSTFTGSSSTAWKYTSGVKMLDKYRDNYAMKSIDLKVGSVIKIVKHGYDSSGDSYNNVLKSYSESTAATTAAVDWTDTTTKGEISITKSGTYDLYVNAEQQISVGAFTPKALSLIPNNSILPRKAGVSNSRIGAEEIGFQANSNWNQDSATFWIYLFKAGGSNEWREREREEGDYHIFNLAGIDDYDQIIFVRGNPLEEPGWGGGVKWNQSGDISLSDITSHLGYGAVLNSDAGWDSWGSNKLSWYSYCDTESYYLIGSGGYFGNSDTWSYKNTLKLDEAPGSDKAKKTSIIFAANTKFIICKFNGNGTLNTYCSFSNSMDANNYDTTAFSSASESILSENRTYYKTNREVILNVFVNSSNVVYITVAKYTVTLKAVNYDSTGTSVARSEYSYGAGTYSVYHNGTFTFASALTGNNAPSTYASNNSLTWDGYWYSEYSGTTWDSGDRVTSSVTIDGNKTFYTKFNEIPFEITVQVGYVSAASPSLVKSGFGGSATLNASNSTTVDSEFLDDANPAYDSTNYSTFVGYYKNITNGSFSDELDAEGENFGGDTTIYKVYRSGAMTVSYNHRLRIKEKGANSYSDFSGTVSLSNRDYSGIYYGSSFSTSTYQPYNNFVGYDSYGAYKFIWDGIVYTDSTRTSVFTSGAPITQTTLYVDLVAVYEKINVAVRATDTNWLDNTSGRNIELYFKPSTSSNGEGSYTSLTMNSNTAADGSKYFRIGINDTDNSRDHSVTFNIRNSVHSVEGDWTDSISSISNADSNSKARGTFDDTITILQDKVNTGTYKNHKKWQWSYYYGNDNSAKLYIKHNGSVTGYDMKNGDGVCNMFIYDAGLTVYKNDEFAIRYKHNSSYHWYGFEDCFTETQKINLQVTLDGSGNVTGHVGSNGGTSYGDSNSYMSSASTKTVGTFGADGSYNFYLTSSGNISISSVPAEKGEGYYIMPYSSTPVSGKNTTTGSYTNGVKLRSIPEADDGDNHAVYTHFYVDGNGSQYYIRSFIDGVDYGLIKSLDTNNLATINATTGIMTFTSKGYYDLYVAKSGSTMTIYVAKSDSTFNALNSFKNTSLSVEENNTSLILEIGFKVSSNLKSKMGIMLTRSASSTGLSNYLMFSVYCSGTTKLGKSCYSTMRGSHYSGSTFGSGKAILNVIDDSNPITNCDGSTVYYLYVLIDYKDKTIKDNTSKAFNDFNISLIARSY